MAKASKKKKAARSRTRKILRIAAWCLVGLVLLVFILTSVVLIMLANLDNSTIKGWVTGYLEDNYGLQVDYELLSISPFSGLEAENLRVATPGPYRDHAPDLLEIGRLDLEWDFWPLLSGKLRLGPSRLKGLRLCLVSDEQGGSSLASLLEGFGPPAAEEPVDTAEAEPLPLSRTLEQGLDALTVESFSIEGIELDQIELKDDKPQRRTSVSSLGLEASIQPEGGNLDMRVILASPEGSEGTRIVVEEASGSPEVQAREMVLRVRNAVTSADPKEITLELDVDLVRQNLFEDLRLQGRLVGLRSRVGFHPGQDLTRLTLEKLDIADAAFATELSVDLLDRPGGSFDPRITSLTGKMDLGRLLGSIPVLLEGIELENATVSYTVTDLALDMASGQVLGGDLRLQARIDAARMNQNGELLVVKQALLDVNTAGDPAALDLSGKIAVDGIQLTNSSDTLDLKGFELGFHAQDVRLNLDAPARGKVNIHLDRANLTQGRKHVKLVDLDLVIVALVRSLSEFDVDIKLPVRKAIVRMPGMLLNLNNASIGLGLQDFELNQAVPLHSKGQIRLETSLGRMKAKTPAIRVSGRRLGLSVNTALSGQMPLKVQGKIPLGRLLVQDRKSRRALLGVNRGKMSWRLSDLQLDLDHPGRTSAKVKLDASLPAVKVMGDMSFSVPGLQVQATRRGRSVYTAGVRLNLDSFSIDGKRRDVTLVTRLDARADLRKPGFKIDLGIQGPRGPEVDVDISGRYTASERSLAYDAQVDLANLGLFADLLPARIRKAHRLDWQSLGIKLRGKGEVKEVIQRFVRGTTPVLATNPIEALRGAGNLTLDIQGLDYQSDGVALQTPGLSFRFEGSRLANGIRAAMDIDAKHVMVQTGSEPIDIRGLTESVRITSAGAPERGRVTLDMTVGIQRLQQAMLRGYPVANARLKVRGHVDRLASLRIEEVTFENPSGGTRLELRAAVDRRAKRERLRDRAGEETIPGRQALSLRGSLSQNLDAVDIAPDAIQMRGKVLVPFRLESGDLATFRLAAKVKTDDVNISLPGSGIALENLHGDIPLIEDIALGADGKVQVLMGLSKNIYSRTRFLDVHPFLKGDNFISVGKLKLLGQEIGPIAGNLRIDRDTIALDQMQIGYRGGKITGQILADVIKGHQRVFFKGNVTGVRPSDSSEVLDANATLTFIPDKLSLEGRVQIVRISKQHLHDLLDLLDPYQENVGINRARLGLKFGYPKFLRLRIKDGLVAVKIELGGVAGVVRLDEITNIALGPFMNLYVAPLLK